MINELELVENLDLLFSHKIVLYGAGGQGRRIGMMLQFAGIEVSYYCDSGCEKWGNHISGLKIISPRELADLDAREKVVIIVTSDQMWLVEDIIGRIRRLSLRTGKLYTMFGLETALARHAEHTGIHEEYRAVLKMSRRILEASINNDIRKGGLRIIDCLQKIDRLLVYQPGKVGSTSIMNSLSAINMSSVHIHAFYENIMINTAEMDDFLPYYRSLIAKQGPVKIITLIREPLGRDLSLFFELKFTAAKKFNLNDTFLNWCAKGMKINAMEYYDDCQYGMQFDWFNRELKAVFGIDVYAHPFDREQGYGWIHQDNIEVLVLKLEKLNNLEKIISDFIGAPHFKLLKGNEGKNKTYRYLYQNVKDEIVIPRDLVSLYYENNQAMDHFYTEVEKAVFLKKWKIEK